MEITQDKVAEIIKNNFYISELYDYFGEDNITLDFLDGGLQIMYKNTHNVDVCVKNADSQSIVPLQIDTTNYDEKFSDVEQYEVEDMGVKIVIFPYNGEIAEELNETNIWKYLYFHKEPLSKK